MRVQAYIEIGGHDEPLFSSIGDETHGGLDSMPARTPYPVVFPFNTKHQGRRHRRTVSVYNFLELIEFNLWRKYV